MKIAMFYHTLLSDWNHGNAHFLRGIACELLARGHEVNVYEPRDSWSLQSLVSEHGWEPVRRFEQAYPTLKSIRYDLNGVNLDRALQDVDLVLVHEWNEPSLVQRIGEHHCTHRDYTLLFHDTHHRMVTEPEAMGRYDLSHYDGVLAYGEVLRRMYQARGNVSQVWTWHEAADTRVFRPFGAQPSEGDLVWIGNWGDDERTAELHEFLIEPCRRLKLKARVYGVRYPEPAKRALEAAGIHYAGWLPNFEVPKVFSRFKVTVHVPRRPYTKALPGIPTIRPFEAMACGIPLVSSPWSDVEHLFNPGKDFLFAQNGEEMTELLQRVLADACLAEDLADSALKTIHARHTCAHRVAQLLDIHASVRNGRAASEDFQLTSQPNLNPI
jgi:spore maturation protein CgeB